MIVLVLWDLTNDRIAHDPLGRYGDGLAPLAVYTDEAHVGRAQDRARAQGQSVEIRPAAIMLEVPVEELEPADVAPARDTLRSAPLCEAVRHWYDTPGEDGRLR